MDPNKLIRKIRLDLGLNGILKDMVDDDELMEIITLKTRETFSRYFKHVIVIQNMEFKDRYRDRNNPNKYRLPKKVIQTVEQLDVSINGVKDVEMVRKAEARKIVSDGMIHLPTRSRYSSEMPFMGQHHIRAGYNQARNDLLKSPIECEYLDPYFIFIRRRYYDLEDKKFNLELFSDHPPNLSTIKDSYAETFEKLAKIDVKTVLWENYIAYLNDLDLGHSRIELKKDEWSNAAQEREDMISEFEEVFLSDYPFTIVI